MYKGIEQLSDMTSQIPYNGAKRTEPMSGRDRDIIETLKIHKFWTECPILLKF